MLKYCVNQWEKNKENLRKAFEAERDYDLFSYQEFAEIVIKNIFPDWKAHVVDAHYLGDAYSGDVIFFIHSRYDEHCYLSNLYYGSCTVCDTLQRAAGNVNDLMTVALHLVQGMREPFDVEN